MTFVLFSQVTMLGEVRSPGGGRPTIDPAGEPVPEQDDGRTPTRLGLGSVSAGFVTAPDDGGQTTFSSTGLEVELTCTDSRLVFVAHSEAAGQWVGQVPSRSITDVLVRARAGRRDHGRVRLLFLEPGAESGSSIRHFVDLVPARRASADEIAWAIVDRAAYDRHRWIAPSAAADHQAIEAIRSRGPVGEPGSYWIPAAAAHTARVPVEADADAVEQTIRLARAAVDHSVPLDRSPWAPPMEATESRAAGTPLPIDGMIMSVPGVTGAQTSTPPDPRPGPSMAEIRIEFDTGETLTLTSPTLIGRDPAALPGESVVLQSIPDPSFSFSKTHLLLEPAHGQITVTDRHSTNGVIAEDSAQIVTCAPGVPQQLDLPVTLRIGTRRLQVSAIHSR